MMDTGSGFSAWVGNRTRLRYLNLACFFLTMLYLGMQPQLFYTLEFQPVKASAYPQETKQYCRQDVFLRSENGASGGIA